MLEAHSVCHTQLLKRDLLGKKKSLPRKLPSLVGEVDKSSDSSSYGDDQCGGTSFLWLMISLDEFHEVTALGSLLV